MVVLALDWTPNVNHTGGERELLCRATALCAQTNPTRKPVAGFYLAKALGYFKEAGLEAIEILSPHTDGYKATPASRAANGSAAFAICPSVSIPGCIILSQWFAHFLNLRTCTTCTTHVPVQPAGERCQLSDLARPCQAKDQGHCSSAAGQYECTGHPEVQWSGSPSEA